LLKKVSDLSRTNREQVMLLMSGSAKKTSDCSPWSHASPWTPSFSHGTGGPKLVDSDLKSIKALTISNGACTVKVQLVMKHGLVEGFEVNRYTAEITERSERYNNPETDPVKLAQFSTADLLKELERRKDEGRPRITDDNLPVELRGLSSEAFFKVVWRDVLGKEQTISKQRVRDHDPKLMKQIEVLLSNRIANRRPLGELEGITFVVPEGKSHRATKAYKRRGISVAMHLG
jgi:hypothetical protein